MQKKIGKSGSKRRINYSITGVVLVAVLWVQHAFEF